jgi:hypothetical protein
MGHEDIRTTLNHYAKTTPKSLSDAAQVLVDAVVDRTKITLENAAFF